MIAWVSGWAFGIVACAAVWEFLRARDSAIAPHPLTPVFAWIGRGLDRLYRRRQLRALRTIELWAWWSSLRCPAPIMIFNGAPATIVNRPYARPALKMGYRAFLFLDKFDRAQVERFYGGDVGYSDRRLIEMIRGAEC